MTVNNALREIITTQIVQAIESGTMPWRRPWVQSPHSGRPANVVSKKAYRGINPLLLQIHQARYGLSSKWYASFAQWQAKGCSVKKRPEAVEQGDWGCRIVFYKPFTRTVVKDGEEQKREFFSMKTYVVFSADQVDGAEEWRVRAPDISNDAPLSFEPADELIHNTSARIVTGGDSAHYCPTTDTIHMPPKASFMPSEAYYETLLHELTHWSEKRVGWSRTGEDSYAMGELIAELTSVMLCQELQIPGSGTLDNHAAYLGHWLEQMKQDPTFIFKASQQASVVTDYLLAFASGATADAPAEEPASA